jgi:hypothetical protein
VWLADPAEAFNSAYAAWSITFLALIALKVGGVGIPWTATTTWPTTSSTLQST